MIDIEREYEILEFKTRMLMAEITMQGMIAANKDREMRGYNVAYKEQDFIDLIDKYCVGQNSIPIYRG